MIRIAMTLLACTALAAASATAAPPRDPYEAGLAFAACMRAHGVPHPDPDRKGDFRLTAAQEARLRAAGRAKVEAADAACFHFIKPFVSTQPLTPQAHAKAKAVLEQVRTCVREAGFRLGAPVVRNLSRGRAFFGFASSPVSKGMTRAEHACEREVQLATKLDAIIAVDRAPV